MEKIEDYLKQTNQNNKYCLLIDSGTTMYPVFQEITKRIQKHKNLWKDRICIVTNNIPGIQYLMKNGKENPSDDYSEIIVDCFLIPGKPLSVYAAIRGNESISWLDKLKTFLEAWNLNRGEVKVISFVTGNYMTRNPQPNKTFYFPAARGEGHVEIKNKMVEVSDEVFLLSPLMKFSFAGVDLLNSVNNFNIDRTNSEALRSPRQVKYEEIHIPSIKAIRFFPTKRIEGNIFERFSEELALELERHYGKENIFMPEMDIKNWIPGIQEKPHLEILREIPHDNLRDSYNEKKKNIWSLKWVTNNESEA